MKTAAALCYGIRRRAAMFNRFLVRLQTVFDPTVWEMTQFVLGGICSFINGSASLGWQGGYSRYPSCSDSSSIDFVGRGGVKAAVFSPIIDDVACP